MAKNQRNTSPSPSHRTLDSLCAKITSFAMMKSMMPERMANGISFQVVDFCTLRFAMSAQVHSMRRMFAVLLQTTFPMAMSVLPFNAAVRLTTSSGAEVQKATTVKPMTMGATPARFESEAAHLTRASAP